MSICDKTEVDFNLQDEFVESYANQDNNMTPLGYTVYKRTYARNIEEEDRTEEWHETVRRVVEGTFTVQKRHCDDQNLPWDETKARKSARKMYDLIFNFKFTPPGRGLWMMGADYIFERETNAPLMNCAFRSTKDIDEDFASPFTFMMDMSMLGVGVGSDTRGKDKVTIKKPYVDEDWTYTVPDSREGWRESIKILLNGYGHGETIPADFDYSEIRPKGAELKGFGGTASGPQPLIDLHENIHKLLGDKVGHKIDAETIVDLHNLIGKCVVAGGIRRTAQIMFGDPDNENYLRLKDPESQSDYWDEPELQHHRWASNNSVFADIGMEYDKPAEFTAKNGEPGFIWLENAHKRGRMKDGVDTNDNKVMGSNPCLTGDSLVHTENGMKRIDELAAENNKFDVTVDSREAEEKSKTSLTGAFKTGEKQTYTVKTEEGYTVTATKDHKLKTNNGWKKLKNLEAGDRLHVLDREGQFSEGGDKGLGHILGWLVGDGQIAENYAALWMYDRDTDLSQYFAEEVNKHIRDSLSNNPNHVGVNHINRHDTDYPIHQISSKRFRELAENFGLADNKLQVPDKIYTDGRETAVGFLQGLFTADGGVQGAVENGISVRLTSVDKKLLQDVQMLLANFGIFSTIYTDRKPEELKEMPDGRGGTKKYRTQGAHDLVISKDDLERFNDKIGFIRRDKQKQLERGLDAYTRGPYSRKFAATVKTIERNGVEPVYDLNEPDTNTYAANGIVVHNCGEQLLEDGELCNLVETYPVNHESLDEWKETLKYAYMYAKTVTLLPNHNERSNSIMMRNRRIGCSISGITQAFQKFGRRQVLEAMSDGYENVQEWDEVYSDWLCIPESVRTTTVKPSGTVSRLADVTSGIHYPISKYYIRNIRFQDTSPLLDQLRDAGFPIEDDKYSDDTKVVSFPMKRDYIERGESEVSMWEQLENVAQVQKHWSDNAVSCTIKFDPETEADDIPRALSLYEDKLKTISFLPNEKDVYDQAPYIPISEEEYRERLEQVGGFTLRGDTHEKNDKFCSGDTCEVEVDVDE